MKLLARINRSIGMKTINEPTPNASSDSEHRPLENNLKLRVNQPRRRSISRRSFLGQSFAIGAGTIGVGLIGDRPMIEPDSHGLTPGDAALLRFPAALELLEADFWIQYNELGGVQDPEVPGGTGNKAYTEAIEVLDE